MFIRMLVLLGSLVTAAALVAGTELPVVKARRADLPLVAVESGEIQAVNSQLVRPPLEWYVDLVVVSLVDEGTAVAAGDPVVQLDPSGLDRLVREAEDRLTSLESQRRGMVAGHHATRQSLTGAVAGAELAREQAGLQRQKLRFEATARQQEAQFALDRAGIDLEEARAKLAAQAVLDSLELAKTDLDIIAARNELDAVNGRIEALTVRAPIAGMVIHHEREDRDGNRAKPRVGDVIEPWQPVVEIPDLSAMQVDFMVHEVDRHRISVGQAVSVRLEAYPEIEFHGQVDEIARLATEVADEEGVRGFAARARLSPSDPRLRPGMTAVVQVTLGRLDDAIVVDRAALAELGGQTVVYPRRDWPRARPVQVRALTPLVAAIADGVADGEELVAPLPAQQDGARPLGAARHFGEDGS